MLALDTEDPEDYELLVRGMILDSESNTGATISSDLNSGVRIAEFDSSSPAVRAGCQVGDSIISVTFPVHFILSVDTFKH